MKWLLASIVVLGCVGCDRQEDQRPAVRLNAVVETGRVEGTAEDPAIWIDHENADRSTVIGSDKVERGALYVWEILTGKEVYRTGILDEPVNPDVRQGVEFEGKKYDIVACGLRGPSTVKVFSVDKETRQLVDISSPKGIPSGHLEALYGFTLYHRQSDGALFAFVTRKERSAEIHQIRLYADGEGKVTGKVVRRLGGADHLSFIEGMVCDDELGYLYVADEQGGILKYYADPDKKDNSLISRFAEGDGIEGDREGIAIYLQPEGKGYLVLSSQGNSTVKIYEREAPNRFVTTVVPSSAKYTNGLDVTSAPIPPLFPEGMLICHDEIDNNFVLYSWKDTGL